LAALSTLPLFVRTLLGPVTGGTLVSRISKAERDVFSRVPATVYAALSEMPYKAANYKQIRIQKPRNVSMSRAKSKQNHVRQSAEHRNVGRYE
jgi:hypothetical protein